MTMYPFRYWLRNSAAHNYSLAQPQLKLRRAILASLALVMAPSLVLAASEDSNPVIQSEQISDVTFSHDGKQLLFTRCGGMLGKCAIHEYDLGTGKLRYYVSPENEVWAMARYSPKGDWIVFVITPIGTDGYRKMDEMQLALMRPDSNGLKRLMLSRGVKIYPSFSPSQKKIIYARAGRIRQSGRTPAADYDVFSTDLSTNQETKLTQFGLILISTPFYIDENTFIYAGEYPTHFPGVDANDRKEIQRRREQLVREFGSGQVYLQKENESNPVLWAKFTGYFNRPLISGDGQRIFFETSLLSPKGKLDWNEYQYFEYRSDGKHHQVTNLPKRTSIWSADVSRDGKQLALITSPFSGVTIGRSKQPRALVIVGIETGATRNISLPGEATPINR